LTFCNARKASHQPLAGGAGHLIEESLAGDFRGRVRHFSRLEICRTILPIPATHSSFINADFFGDGTVALALGLLCRDLGIPLGFDLLARPYHRSTARATDRTIAGSSLRPPATERQRAVSRRFGSEGQANDQGGTPAAG
jgi:hypothetical protein